MLKKIGWAVLILIIIGVIFGDGEGSSSSSSNLASAEPDFDVSCAAMASELEANEARASAKYTDKIIKISGYVDSIDEDMWGDNVVSLSSGDEWSFTSCMLNDVSKNIAISLDKGQAVSFTCNDFIELMGSADLSNCSAN